MGTGGSCRRSRAAPPSELGSEDWPTLAVVAERLGADDLLDQAGLDVVHEPRDDQLARE